MEPRRYLLFVYITQPVLLLSVYSLFSGCLFWMTNTHYHCLLVRTVIATRQLKLLKRILDFSQMGKCYHAEWTHCPLQHIKTSYKIFNLKNICKLWIIRCIKLITCASLGIVCNTHAPAIWRHTLTQCPKTEINLKLAAIFLPRSEPGLELSSKYIQM